MTLYLPVLLLLCLCRLGLTDETSMVAPEDHSCGEPVFRQEALRSVGGAVERLGWQLLNSLQTGPEQPNVILSPLSVALALAQLALGEARVCVRMYNVKRAHNETQKLLLSSLHAHTIPCYHHTLGSLLQHLTNTSLQVATRMYLRPEFEVYQSFVAESLHRYRSEPAPLISVEEVNQWVEDATKGHITNFLPSIPHDIVLMLINAVHFKGEWEARFDPQLTQKDVFYLDNKNFVHVDMMRSAKYPLSLLEDGELGAQVARFPFKGNTSFLVVMPLPGRGNVSSLVTKLNISDLYRRLPQESTMQVQLPKFTLQYRQELQEALTSMGLGSLFSGPDLSGISAVPLQVSSVRHACGVELSEEGADASAATSVTMMRSIPIFFVNSPFLFALVDHASLAPLFLGTVTNPAPDTSPMRINSLLGDDPHGNRTQSDSTNSNNDVQSDGPHNSNNVQ
ncbi:alpha-2-antiplasmin isoform X1 [Coregonus clupeaformis]|uniref:alpha-2-antiplasmin isoform X1 n=1 Tax=Coregonus clupeaformis TaxID=59861 RepID=UPI001BE05089|nr:alpha-2-antiplasmin isoform X1 [Coregonus clupeaformis]XP_041741648.1 alpha-2-antiplasmin isoform X1 [Coregonus clupeaformis]XP_041741649.1 alpha-2-antiplasmin isoform X1 [Coregonus clupeaformis]XP_041741650.1 alpha-2-antiplasmin isoform X1 [Coregonus clupeaformis]